MSISKSAGSFIGTSAATVIVGTGNARAKLAAAYARTEFAAGVAEGYAERAFALRTQRAALGRPSAPVIERKLATKAKA